MGSKSELCLYCGRFTELKAKDGLAECDRQECIANREEGWETIDWRTDEDEDEVTAEQN